MSTNDERWLTPKEVAEKLSVGLSTLREWRRHGKGPKSIRLGHRTVRYDPRSVQAFIEASQQNSGDE